MKKLFAGVVCFSLSALMAVAGDAGKAPKVEGVWNVTGGSSDGKKIPQEVVDKLMLVVTFKDGKYTASVMGKQIEAGTYTIEAKKKAVNIDVTITEGNDKDKMQLGILKVEADVVTIAFAKAGAKERPKNFDGGEGIDISILKKSK